MFKADKPSSPGVVFNGEPGQDLTFVLWNNTLYRGFVVFKIDTKVGKVLVPQSELLPGGEVGHNSWNPNLYPHNELVLPSRNTDHDCL